jgi:hypothetical protein
VPASTFDIISTWDRTEVAASESSPRSPPTWVIHRATAMPIASRYSGYSRNMRLTQNVRTLPLPSSDAGTMYPLMRKKTKTP